MKGRFLYIVETQFNGRREAICEPMGLKEANQIWHETHPTLNPRVRALCTCHSVTADRCPSWNTRW